MILDKFKLDGKVAIVTGSSTGLGQGVCLAFAEAGASVVGVDYVESTETKQRIEGMGRKFLEIKANLMSIAAIPDIIVRTLAAFGRLDILVNNAGIIRREDAIDFSEKNWDDVMDINAKTVFFFSQAAAKQFIRPGFGRQDHQYRIDALLPGRHQGALIYCIQERGYGHHEAHGQRMGKIWHKRQRDGARLHGDEQYGADKG